MADEFLPTTPATQVAFGADGTSTFTDPDGTVRTVDPYGAVRTVGLLDEDAGGMYEERAHLVALLATHYASLLTFNDPAEPEWGVVYIDTPAGKLSWHIAPGDLHLFLRTLTVAPDRVKWDGHTTEEKYERIRRLLGVS
jgi:hypothetical protein